MKGELVKLLSDKGLYDDFTVGQLNGEKFHIISNTDTIKNIETLAKDAGIEFVDIDEIMGAWGFDDEWCKCSGCMNVFNFYPSFYGETSNYVLFENDGYYCIDCAKEFKDSYLDGIINDPTRAVQKNVIDEQEIATLGFVKISEGHEQGYHEGQNADPQQLFNEASKQYSDVIFMVDNVGQFDVSFSVWGRNQE
jgi:hypothetical protein